MNPEFTRAVDLVSSGALGTHINDSQVQLHLYGLYKQGIQGDCAALRPGIFQVTQRRKWDAWNQHTGLSRCEAQDMYVHYVYTFLEKSDEAPQTGMGLGVSSRPAQAPEVPTQDRDLSYYAANEDTDSLKSHWDYSFRDSHGRTALHIGGDRGLVAVLVAVLGLPDAATLLDVLDNDGYTALHYACICGHEDAAVLLVESGASLDIRSASGETIEELGGTSFYRRLCEQSN